MGVFGPKYPHRLQEVVSHAERFGQLLSRWQDAGRFAGDRAEAWVVGRLGEIELALALTVSDWKRGRLGLEDAAKGVEAYLLELHAGVRAVVAAPEAELDCCCDEVFLTEIVSADSVTRLVRPAVTSPDAGVHDTWFDPAVVLGEGPAGAPVGGRMKNMTKWLEGLVGARAKSNR